MNLCNFDQRGLVACGKKKFLDEKFLAGILFACGDYIALILSAYLSLRLRNMIMTYNTYEVMPVYVFFWLPFVFMSFILYEGLYTKRMLTYKIIKKLFYASLSGTIFSIILMFIGQVAGDVSRLFVAFFALFGFVLL